MVTFSLNSTTANAHITTVRIFDKGTRHEDAWGRHYLGVRIKRGSSREAFRYYENAPVPVVRGAFWFLSGSTARPICVLAASIIGRMFNGGTNAAVRKGRGLSRAVYGFVASSAAITADERSGQIARCSVVESIPIHRS